MKLNIAICEDEQIHRKILLNYLEKVFPEALYNAYEFNSGGELLKNYPENLDILLLDIQMDGINGIEVARRIRNFDTNVSIVFITSIFDFIQEGYEVRAFRYLLKPIKYEEFSKHLIECRKSIINGKEQCITVKEVDKGRVSIVPISSILYIERLCRMTLIHTDKNVYKTRECLNIFEKELEGHLFYRCHRSYLINLNKVTSIGKDIVFVRDSEIKVSRYKIKDLKYKMTDLLGSMI